MSIQRTQFLSLRMREFDLLVVFVELHIHLYSQNLHFFFNLQIAFPAFNPFLTLVPSVTYCTNALDSALSACQEASPLNEPRDLASVCSMLLCVPCQEALTTRLWCSIPSSFTRHNFNLLSIFSLLGLSSIKYQVHDLLELPSAKYLILDLIRLPLAKYSIYDLLRFSLAKYAVCDLLELPLLILAVYIKLFCTYTLDTNKKG